jgi:hypothetical protein
MAELARRAKRAAPLSETASLAELRASYVGRIVHHPDGVRIGHVGSIEPDGMGGAWLDVFAEWGILDWLLGMGSAERPHFRLHSDDVELQGDRDLIVKKSLLEAAEEKPGGKRAA